MNETPNRPNANRARFSPQRLARVKPMDQDEEKVLNEPVREDLEENQEQKPSVPLARRPIPLGNAQKPAEGPRGLNILNPPSLARRGQPGNPPGSASPLPRLTGSRFESSGSAPAGSKNDARVPAPAPVSLPTGIQRGFPRQQPIVNGAGRDVRPIPAPSPRPLTALEEPLREDVPLVDDATPMESGAAQADLPEVNQDVPSKGRPRVEFFLEEILDRLANPPAQTALLGVCDDQLPVLIDLNDPAPGAILVVSDDDMLRTRLLRTLVQTSAALNSPRNVQFIVFTSQPQEWQSWIESQEILRHCLSIERLPQPGEEPSLEGSPDRWLVKLSSWADQRRSSGISGPAVVLIVDDLRSATGLEYDARVNFDWLVKEGPGVRIWPVVGLRSDKAKELTRWVRLFKTRLIGPAVDAATVQQLSSGSELEVEPAQFAVRVQEQWLKFRVPILPNEVY